MSSGSSVYPEGGSPPPNAGSQIRQAPGMPRTLWMLIAMVLLLAAAFWLFTRIEKGSLSYYDETLTASRVSCLAESGDYWRLESNHLPTLAKPPLYYWLSVWTAPLFQDAESRVRFWSAVFAMGCLLAVAWLTSILVPLPCKWPGGILAALLLCFAEQSVLLTGSLALLDTGAAFFWVLGFCFLLRSNTPSALPMWGWALCVWGQAMIKYPFLFPAGILFIFAMHGRGFRKFIWNRKHLIPVLFAGLGVIFWPLTQVVLNGFQQVYETGYSEVSELYAKTAATAWGSLTAYASRLWHFGGPLTIAIYASILVVLAIPMLRRDPRVRGIALVACLMTVATLLGKRTDIRYLLPVLAIAAPLFVTTVFQLFRGKTMMVYGLVVLLILPHIKITHLIYSVEPVVLRDQLYLIARLKQELGSDERPVFVLPPDQLLLTGEMVQYYADLPMPVAALSLENLATFREGEKLEGISTKEDWDRIQTQMEDPFLHDASGAFVQWSGTIRKIELP